jgi:hypothetical protein
MWRPICFGRSMSAWLLISLDKPDRAGTASGSSSARCEVLSYERPPTLAPSQPILRCISIPATDLDQKLCDDIQGFIAFTRHARLH